MRVVYAMFPRKPGSNAARHTLIFRGSNWQIVNMDTMYQFSEYMNVLTGEFSNQKNNNNVYRAELKVDGNTFYIGVCDEEPYTNLDSYIDLDVKREISWFTPSVHKSLIQKCIRVIFMKHVIFALKLYVEELYKEHYNTFKVVKDVYL